MKETNYMSEKVFDRNNCDRDQVCHLPNVILSLGEQRPNNN